GSLTQCAWMVCVPTSVTDAGSSVQVAPPSSDSDALSACAEPVQVNVDCARVMVPVVIGGGVQPYSTSPTSALVCTLLWLAKVFAITASYCVWSMSDM